MAHSIHDLPARQPRSRERRPTQPAPPTLPEAIILLGAGLRAELHHVAVALQSLGSGSAGVTPEQFNLGIQKIMSVISDFAERLAAHNARVETALTGLSEDVAALKAKIEELQNTPGGITAEDQELLNQIEVQVGSVADRLEGLDQMTPPTPPVEPPVE